MTYHLRKKTDEQEHKKRKAECGGQYQQEYEARVRGRMAQDGVNGKEELERTLGAEQNTEVLETRGCVGETIDFDWMGKEKE